MSYPIGNNYTASREPCMCGADDCWRCFPNRRRHSLDLDRALEEVVECITMHGQWPAPNFNRHAMTRQPAVRFSLEEYMVEEMDASDLAQFVIHCLARPAADFMDERAEFETKLQASLRDHLDGHQMVIDHAEQLAEDGE